MIEKKETSSMHLVVVIGIFPGVIPRCQAAPLGALLVVGELQVHPDLLLARQVPNCHRHPGGHIRPASRSNAAIYFLVSRIIFVVVIVKQYRPVCAPCQQAPVLPALAGGHVLGDALDLDGGGGHGLTGSGDQAAHAGLGSQ